VAFGEGGLDVVVEASDDKGLHGARSLRAKPASRDRALTARPDLRELDLDGGTDAEP
jgi:hypothetical protein